MTATQGSPPTLSFVVPAHDEEGSVVDLHAELTKAAREFDTTYEIVFVNDGSRDGTLARLTDLLPHDPNLCVVDLQGNFGESAALSAGFAQARGRYVLTLDADGQNDPADFSRLLRALDDRYDVASGWRRQREDGFWLRVLPSRIANGLIRIITGVPVHDCGCTLKVYRKEVLVRTDLPRGMHRFLPAIAGIDPGRIVEVPVSDRPRASGTSHYGLSRTFVVMRDLVGLPLVLRQPRAGRATARFLGATAAVSLSGAAVLIASAAPWLALGAGTLGAGAIAARHVIREFIDAEEHGVFRVRRVLHGTSASDRNRRSRLLGPEPSPNLSESPVGTSRGAV